MLASRATRPLSGLRIAVTRPAEENDELPALLRTVGAEVVTVPLTRILPPLDAAPLHHAWDRLAAFDWAAFTSARAARAVDGDWTPFRGRIAVVGPATGAVVARVTGRIPEVVPSVPGGAALATAMSDAASLRGAHVFWPRSAQARVDFPNAMRAAGALVTDPIAYRTVADENAARALAQMVDSADVDAVVFTAPSAVNSLAATGVDLGRCLVAVIGSTTAEAARGAGMDVEVTSPGSSLAAMVDSLCRFYA